jgi:asparagine synthase (glutamine-hydrolysing)
MSGFFGIFRPQGGPVDLEAFEQMKTDMNKEGFDGMETHVEEKIAMGHLMLRVSPESKYDKQPFKSPCGNYLLVGHFRLDYRDELGDKLGLTQAELELTPDSQLAIKAYQKWKEKCVHHLEGDWAFAIYDYSKESLFIAKDLFGYSAVFYTKSGGHYYFSSLTDCLSNISLLKNEINFNQLFRQSIPYVGPSLNETLLKVVYSIEAGTYSLIDLNLNEEKFKFVDLNNLPVIKFRDELDYSHLLSSFFSQSVRSKIRGWNSVGVFLSGGLDSTAVAYFVLKELHYRGDILKSFTSFPFYLSEISEKHLKVANEVPLVKSFAREHENIETYFLNFPQSKISELLLSDYVFDLFNPIVNPNNFWIEGILKEMQVQKVSMVLNGQLGNYTLTPSAPFIHTEMFFSLRFIELFRELREISISSKKSMLSVFRDRILSPLKFQISTLKKNVLFYHTDFFKFRSLFDKSYSIFNSFNTKKQIEGVPYYSFISSSRKMRLMQVLSISSIGGKMWYKEAEKKALQISDPTSDSRLISYSFSIPEREYNKRGNYKAVYRNMMSGKLPDSVLYNPFKMMQSFDIHFRFKEDQELKRILDEIVKKAHLIPFLKVEELVQLYGKIMKSTSKVSIYDDIFQFLRITSLVLFLFKRKDKFTT